MSARKAKVNNSIKFDPSNLVRVGPHVLGPLSKESPVAMVLRCRGHEVLGVRFEPRADPEVIE